MIAGLIGLGWAACDQQREPVGAPAEATAEADLPTEPAQPARFVGSAACAECHAEVAERWRGSEHARAMQKAAPDTVLGNFASTAFRDGPVTWKFERGEGFRARSEGAERGEFAVAYTIGVDPLSSTWSRFPMAGSSRCTWPGMRGPRKPVASAGSRSTPRDSRPATPRTGGLPR